VRFISGVEPHVALEGGLRVPRSRGGFQLPHAGMVSAVAPLTTERTVLVSDG
jgi:hypothetical protein